MGSTTGIELGPDFCVLVAVRLRRTGPTDVLAFHTIERSEWPLRDAGLTETLRAVRLAKKFPRKARLVVWTLSDGATRDDPAAAAMLRPLIAAGFRVDALLSPPQALLSLAASRPRPGATGAVAWLAVNVHGAAIAIVRGQELLFSRTFEWSYNAAVLGSRAELLQRYSLVARLAPEIQRGLADVRVGYGEIVSTVITCGDLPELRSLTMPLIEELDLEVETLDSTDGLRAVGRARMERFPESAPTIRLACAAALSTSHSSRSRSGVWVWAAAGVALVAALGWGALAYSNRSAGGTDVRATVPVAPQGRSPSVVLPAPVRPAPAASDSKPAPGAAVPSTATRGAMPAGPLASVPRPASPFNPPAPGSGSQPTSITPKVAALSPAAPKPAPTALGPAVTSRPTVTPPASALPPAASIPTATPSKPIQRTTLSPTGQSLPPSVSAPAAPTRSVPAAQPPGSASKPVPGAATPAVTGKPVPTVNPPAGTSRPASAVPLPAPPARPLSNPRASTPGDPVPPMPGEPVVGKRQVPLKGPLPRVDSILIDQDRRLAILDGAVARVGDSVGPRVLVQIDRDGVVLREPSGLVVRVTLRPKSQ